MFPYIMHDVVHGWFCLAPVLCGLFREVFFVINLSAQYVVLGLYHITNPPEIAAEHYYCLK